MNNDCEGSVFQSVKIKPMQQRQLIPKLIGRFSYFFRFAQRYLALHGLCFTANEKMLLDLKNQHKGKRCFVIGNGPSLRLEDLHKLKESKDVTIASNKIYLAFEGTDWRPTYYTVGDLLVAQNNAKEIKNLNIIKFFPDHFKTILGRSKDPDCNGVHLYYCMLRQRYDKNGNYIPSFSPNPLIGLHIGETITNVNIQLAYFIGCDPIYLIGIDGKYNFPSTTVKHHVYEQVFVSEGEINHFLANYRKKGETWCIPKPEDHECGFRHSNAYLKSKDVSILNASRESVVGAFDRVDLDSIL